MDHSRLQEVDGPAYLLQFLEDRLCKAPIPDTGARLEDFFHRLRRAPGAAIAEWSAQLRESYARLQRAMARQRADLQRRQGVSKPSTLQSNSPQPQSSSQTSPEPRRLFSSPAHSPQARPDNRFVEEEGPEPAASQGGNPGTPRQDGWIAAEWEEWYNSGGWCKWHADDSADEVEQQACDAEIRRDPWIPGQGEDFCLDTRKAAFKGILSHEHD